MTQCLVGQRAWLIYNPVAGRPRVTLSVQSAVAHLEQAGWDVSVHPTAGPGDGARLARAAVDAGSEVVIAAGGDGTINEVAQGLAGADAALGILPLGTVNVWARELGVTLAPEHAATVLLTGEVRVVDLGLANDRYFLLMASAGFDAAVVRAAPPWLKRWLGASAYMLTALWRGLGYQGTPTHVVLDGEELDCLLLMALAGNTRLYGGQVEITHQALADDGLLDLYLFCGAGPLDSMRHVWSVPGHRYSGAPGVLYRRVRQATIQPARPLAVQVDGDPLGNTPLTLRVAPRTLRVIVPRGTGSALFSQPDHSLDPRESRLEHGGDATVRGG